MSIQRCTYVVCDGLVSCNEAYEADTDDADEARANAQEDGWSILPKGIDYCPNCQARLKAAPADSQPKSEE